MLVFSPCGWWKAAALKRESGTMPHPVLAAPSISHSFEGLVAPAANRQAMPTMAILSSSMFVTELKDLVVCSCGSEGQRVGAREQLSQFSELLVRFTCLGSYIRVIVEDAKSDRDDLKRTGAWLWHTGISRIQNTQYLKYGPHVQNTSHHKLPEKRSVNNIVW